MNQEAPSPQKILEVGMAFWAAKALLSAVELGLFTELARGPLDQAELVAKLGLNGRGSADLFDGLVALGFLERNEGRYSNTRDADVFLDKAKLSYIGGILEMANARIYEPWGRLTEALRTGKPQARDSESDGEAGFHKLYEDPAKVLEFASAMTGVSMGTSRAIAQKFDWSRVETFVDLGTAQGGLPVQLCQAHAHLHGIGVDLAPVQPVFEEYVARFGLQDRIEFRTADLFADPLPSGEVMIMGHMLHGFGLDQKREMLAKVYAALPAGGALIVFDAVIDDDRRRNAFGLMMSLNMLVETPEGFDYTGADGLGWLREAGFARTSVEPLTGPDSMLIGYKD